MFNIYLFNNNTMAEEKAVAVFNEDMMQEAEKTSHAASVMNGIHEVKAYNANMKD